MMRIAIAGFGVLVLGACAEAPREQAAVRTAVAAADVVASPVAAVADTSARAAMPAWDVGTAAFEGAKPSLEALARAVIDGLATRDRSALLALSVSAPEYKQRLFGAIAQHPAAYRMGADLLWDMHVGESHGHLQQLLERHGGQPLELVALRDGATTTRDGLVFHKRPVLVVRDAQGQRFELHALGTVVEHVASGGFKLLSFRADD
ncbi:MAG: hypothetical protein K1X88_07680 [Nannocystaceae bacterium]|nr:hypothetical protein [Nannocystaceae bacterium]